MKSARVRLLLRFLTLRSRGCVCLKPMNERIEAEIDFRPVVKLFTPDGAATWLLTEIDPAYQDIVFGLCDLGMGCPELGSVSLAVLIPEQVAHLFRNDAARLFRLIAARHSD